MRTSRAAANARAGILTQLKEDHKRVKKAYRDFQKLDHHEDQEQCRALVEQVLSDLRMHSALEEELLYPPARGVVAEDELIDEAEVEHQMLHVLIDQLASMGPEDDLYAARFTVLCEYVAHHVKEEEGELFPQLERARLDWETLARDMDERRGELTASGAPAGGPYTPDRDRERAGGSKAKAQAQEEEAQEADAAR